MKPAGESNPISPEQSKTQVVDLAREVVHTLDLQTLSAVFRHSSCNDDGVAPYRGEVVIGYPLAASMAESDAEVAAMIEKLRGNGWTDNPDFHSHSSVLQKNGVVIAFDPQTVSDRKRGITLRGECRDVTTSTRYGTPFEDVNLG